MKNFGNQPTIIEPNDYKNRFLKAMKNYFVKVKNDLI